MSELDSKAAAADAMLRAGNLTRAKELCREVLEKDDSHFDAFATLIDVRFKQEDLHRARALCHWRLERFPECEDTNLIHLHVLGMIGEKAPGKKCIKNLRLLLSGQPVALQQAELLYTHYFGSKRKTRKLLKQARESGYFSQSWLDGIETENRSESGHIFSTIKLLKKSLKENPENADDLYAMSVLSVLTGRLFSALKYGRQGRRLDPSIAPAFNETIFAAFVGLIPLFWAAQLYIILNATLTTRLFWLLRIPFNIGFILFAFIVQGLIIAPIALVSEPFHEFVSGLSALLNIIWIIYLLFGFQKIGMALSKREVNVALSPDY